MASQKKNKHLLEVTRAFVFTNGVPKYLLGDALLTATYLINRMPTKVLDYKTPLSVFKNTFHASKLTTDLPLRVFECSAFVHIHSQNRGKLDSRARKCIFVGYALNQRGYKCYDVSSKKMFVIMDVTFFESQLFFSTHFQGESLREDSNFEIETEIETARSSNFLINTELGDVSNENLNPESIESSHNINKDENREQTGTQKLLVYRRKNQKQGIETKLANTAKSLNHRSIRILHHRIFSNQVFLTLYLFTPIYPISNPSSIYLRLTFLLLSTKGSEVVQNIPCQTLCPTKICHLFSLPLPHNCLVWKLQRMCRML